MKFLLMVCVDESIQRDPEKYAAHIREVGAWAGEAQRNGVRVLGDRLRASGHAVRLRRDDAGLEVSDGPFAETKEQMAGFDVLDCADLQQAIEVASAHPGLTYGSIELRPFWPVPSGD